MDVFDAITTRVSVTQYQDKGVDREDVARILEAGRWAPSAGNMQTWEFIVVEEDELKERLSQYAHNQPHIREAPVVIVILTDLDKADRQYGSRGQELYAVQETAAVMQNMLLAAHELELGAAWVGAFEEDMVADALDVPDGVRPVSIITVGHPLRIPEQPNRYQVEEITHMNRYGEEIRPLYDRFIWKGLREYREQAEEYLKNLRDKYT